MARKMSAGDYVVAKTVKWAIKAQIWWFKKLWQGAKLGGRLLKRGASAAVSAINDRK